MPLLNIFSMILVSGVGFAGLLDDEARRLAGDLLTDWHYGFGLALLELVIWRFFSSAELRGGVCCNLRSRARNTTRIIYALLYGIFGVDEVSRLGRCAAAWGSNCTAQPPEALRLYLLYGLFAIATTHLLAALSQYRQIDHYRSVDRLT